MNSLDVNAFNDNNNEFNGSGRQSTETTNRVNYMNTKHVLSEEEFKMPDRFAQELEVLERKALTADSNQALTRMSLLRKFDPLVDTMDVNNDLMTRTDNLSLNEPKNRFETTSDDMISTNSSFVRLNPNQNQNQTIDGLTQDESTTLMNFNSPLIVPNINAKSVDTNEQNLDQILNDFRTKELVFHEKLIEKDRHIHGLEENMNIIDNNCSKYELLVNILHNFNEEVVEMASQVIDSLIRDKNELIERCNQMTAERSQALEEVNNVEKNFYEVHNRYDKVRTALEESKLREMQFNDQYMELVDKLREKEQMYELLKSKAEAKIEDANNYIESARRECESELIGVKAQLKRSEMKINGLQAQLDQKTKENDELTKMVDELIANVEK